MSTMLKKPIVLSMMLLGVLVNANNVEPNSDVIVNSLDAENVRVESVVIKSDTQIQVKDGHGVILFSDEMKVGDTYRKQYDLAELPLGVYFLKIVDEEYSTIYSIEKSYDSLEVEEKFSAPVIDQETLRILYD